MRITMFGNKLKTKEDAVFKALVCAVLLVPLYATSGALGVGVCAANITLFTNLYNNILKVYQDLVSLGTPVAALCAAAACIEMFVFQHEQKIDRARGWLVRILIVFVAINAIGLILGFALDVAGVTGTQDLSTLGITGA